MAESPQGGERTEEPSQRRLTEARERGQVPRSRELTNFATMIGGSVALIAMGSTLAGTMSLLMRRSMSIDPERLEDTQLHAVRARRCGHHSATGRAAHVRRFDRPGASRRGGARRLEFQSRGHGA
jgi:hypothetical protein